MNIIDIIEKDIPDFSGICIREGDADIKKVREFEITLAWKLNKFRAKNYKKILIVGANKNKGKYFIANIVSVLSIKNAYLEGTRKDGFDYQEEIYGKWITERISGVIQDNALEERFAILFENPTEIKKFSSDFTFNRTSIYYVNSEKQLEIKSGEYIEINNIGKINTAKIKINGLTLIAGINDTGKSTAGKVLFSIIKATGRYKQDLKEGKEYNILDKLDQLYNNLRRRVLVNDIIRQEFIPKNFIEHINNYVVLDNFDGLLVDEIEKLFDFKKTLLTENISNKENLKGYIKTLDEIKQLLFSKEDKQEQIKNALNRALFSEFISDITPKGSTKKSHIRYYIGNDKLLDVELEKNKITKLDSKEDLSFRDVVFVETPLLIQMYDLIKYSDAMFDDNEDDIRYRNRPKVSLHIKDLINKIENAKYFSELFYENDFDSIDILKNISNIINGGFAFDNENKDLIFTSKNGKNKNFQIKSVNTASGIKSFGIIQLLLQANILNDRCLLIIDEPENHLHPEWQIKYAEMIIELVKNEIPVIITSHSPYIIQALRHFSEKNKLEEKTSYYYAEMKENETQSNLIDVTNDLNVIFSKLAEPLSTLVWK
ncbi:MAG: AAA family ATPase [Flavobacterium sp.]|uniref:AAA family ATPase n=1 Tax=Flavobacterium sp. TaxID=239 RepID=UPI002603C5D7|nr:AAA family ATPase [Flavobacterium sp.]MDD5151658.1 AAA family ATPase [Flavobacterium sp.]